MGIIIYLQQGLERSSHDIVFCIWSLDAGVKISRVSTPTYLSVVFILHRSDELGMYVLAPKPPISIPATHCVSKLQKLVWWIWVVSELGLIIGKQNKILERKFTITREVWTLEKDLSPVLIQVLIPFKNVLNTFITLEAKVNSNTIYHISKLIKKKTIIIYCKKLELALIYLIVTLRSH